MYVFCGVATPGLSTLLVNPIYGRSMAPTSPASGLLPVPFPFIGVVILPCRWLVGKCVVPPRGIVCPGLVIPLWWGIALGRSPVAVICCKPPGGLVPLLMWLRLRQLRLRLSRLSGEVTRGCLRLRWSREDRLQGS
jgi:hypothetical protein